MSDGDALRAIRARELREILDEELRHIPRRYRDAIVLCDLEGMTRAQASKHLDCTEFSVKAALARGRQQLRKRMVKRGFVLSMALAATNAAIGAASDEVASDLIDATVTTCMAEMHPSSGTLPDTIHNLSREGFIVMTAWSIGKTVAILCIPMMLIATPLVLLAQVPVEARSRTSEITIPPADRDPQSAFVKNQVLGPAEKLQHPQDAARNVDNGSDVEGPALHSVQLTVDLTDDELKRLKELTGGRSAGSAIHIAIKQFLKRVAPSDMSVPGTMPDAFVEAIETNKSELRRLEAEVKELESLVTPYLRERHKDEANRPIPRPVHPETQLDWPPKMEGLVLSVSAERVEVSLGSDDGLRAGHNLIVFRESAYLGRVTVERVHADRSLARIDSRRADFRRGDRIATESRPASEASTSP